MAKKTSKKKTTKKSSAKKIKTKKSSSKKKSTKKSKEDEDFILDDEADEEEDIEEDLDEIDDDMLADGTEEPRSNSQIQDMMWALDCPPCDGNKIGCNIKKDFGCPPDKQ